MAKENAAPLRCVLAGVEEEIIRRLKTILPEAELTQTAANARVLAELTVVPDLIFCGPAEPGSSTLEIAQTLRFLHAERPIYYVTTLAANYNRPDFKRHGFTDAFLLPLDWEALRKTLVQSVQADVHPVRLVDIVPGRVLNFATSIFLPKNNRFVGFSAAGDSIDQERVERLKEHQHRTVYVHSDSLPEFYDYTSKALKSLRNSQEMSQTEKEERLGNSVRDLFGGLLADAESSTSTPGGKNPVMDCREIVYSYVLEENVGFLDSKLLKTLGEVRDTYSHASNVSTYAALFSLGICVGRPEELAVAGMLHDLGLAKVPLAVQEKSQSERTVAEQALYEQHPALTLGFLQQRKVPVSETVIRAIAQHHENYNGTGFPKRLASHHISPEAEILAIADAFDEMTSITADGVKLSPIEAIKLFRKQMARPRAKLLYNPKVLSRILSLLPDPGNADPA